ncbi:hypothetical protein ACVRW4_07750, partial [Streptococcus phocae subsp. phocae]
FHKILSNDGLVAFHYKSYGTFLVLKKPYNLQSGVTHYRNYRADYFRSKLLKITEENLAFFLD